MLNAVDKPLDPNNIELFNPFHPEENSENAKDRRIAYLEAKDQFSDDKIRYISRQNQRYKDVYLQRKKIDEKNKKTNDYKDKVVYYEQVNSTCPGLKVLLCMRKTLFPDAHRRAVEKYYAKDLISTKNTDEFAAKIMQEEEDLSLGDDSLPIEKDIEIILLENKV